MIAPNKPFQPNSSLSHFKKFVIRVAVSVFLAWLLALAAQHWLVDLFQVSNRSMVPTLYPGDAVIIEKISPGLVLSEKNTPGAEVVRWKYPLHRRLQINDLIVFFSPVDDTPMIKRITAIGKEGLTVLGDNRENSLDSRKFGPISESRVIGRVISSLQKKQKEKNR